MVKVIWTHAIMFSLALVLGAPPAFGNTSADASATGVPDNSEARKYLQETIFAPTETVLSAAPRLLTQSAGVRHVNFSVEKTDESYYLLFSNEVEGTYPIAAAGNYIIRRNLATGKFEQVKIFLSDDPGMFVRIFPGDSSGSIKNERSFMDVFIGDEPVVQGVPVPISFQQVLTNSFAWVMDLTSADVNWSDFFAPADLSAYLPVEHMVTKARQALPTLPDADDGAMDQNGDLVYIASLKMQNGLPGFNCSGFAKWVADGLFKPQTGRYLSIDELKKKQIGVRGNAITDRYEYARDPYFGLDWSRNIATTLMRLQFPGREIGPTDADVNDVPYNHYIQNVGYPVARLGQILYLQAVRDPGYFYIGSVNREFGTDPVLRQHVHVVVLFPYFTQSGKFVVSVMERNVETSVASLDQRYHDDHIHLVKVLASEDYTPPKIRIAAN